MKKKILITGASGFIGSWVTRKLVAYDVVAVVSPFSEPWRLRGIEKKVKVVKADLSQISQAQKIFNGFKPDYVIHLATHGVYQYQQGDDKRIVEDNYMMTFNLLKESVRTGVKRFINTGSVFEYGSRPGKVKERDVDITDILNEYSAVKMATTALASSFADKINVITLRPFTAYGPAEDPARFIPLTIKRAKLEEPIHIVKGVVRDFVYVEDIAAAYLEAIKKDFVSGSVLNVGSGRRATLEEAALLIKTITNSKSPIVNDKKYVRKKESRCWADISKTKKVLGWTPKYSLKDGIGKTINYGILTQLK
ncbi:MAG TPA: NAD(P)-dependent oxidoreductase [Patescibacteria group bacterium]|nr:NAD(P)-dependent oxidoreductase [Patescibacteria group bacterium]